MRSLSAVWSWVIAHQLAIVASVAVVIGFCRAIPADRWQRIERDWPRAANLIRFLRAIFPDVVKALKVLYTIWTGRPWPAGEIATTIANERPPAPPRIPPMPLLFALVTLALAGCPDVLGPEDGCTPGAWTCRGNRPYVCSATRRWAPAQATCAAGSTCRENTPGILHASLAACIADTAPVSSSGGAQ